MQFDYTRVFNLVDAIIDARNPLESWGRSDSDIEKNEIGPNDLELAKRLIRAGSEHRKFMRQIFVVADWVCPLYLWKEIDQYRIGVTTNSCSTMHKIASKPITAECFEMGDFNNLEFDALCVQEGWNVLINNLECLRLKYVETKDKRYWKELIRMLPESWLQRRTISMSYENIYNMIHQRKNHKLTEWSVDFISWCKTLPYAEELLFLGVEE